MVKKEVEGSFHERKLKNRVPDEDPRRFYPSVCVCVCVCCLDRH